MPSAFRYQNVARWTVISTVTASFLLALIFARIYARSADQSGDRGTRADGGGRPCGAPVTGDVWLALQSRPDKPAGSSMAHPGQDRFRLAGTFFIEGAGESQRRAILDDLAKHDQFIVSEGERLDDTTVDKIFFDHVILRTPSGLRELWVEFSLRDRSPVVAASTNLLVTQSGLTTKFGCIQTQENRWKFSRKPILDYYQELLDDPDRMVSVFDTMKPVRDEKNMITGYVVGLEGEKEFFDAVGLQQGDIVRSVNSFPMTNRRRAEAFIDQFLKDQMNAVVLEVERSGKTVKQVYQLQQ